MANRPVFVVGMKNVFCEKDFTEFEYARGLSKAQKQRSVRNLHNAFLLENPNKKVLEISSASEEEIGVNLSAFHLTIPMKSGKIVSVEVAFQAGKRFQNGGPYTDLLEKTSREAKKDERLKTSGPIIGFSFDGEEYPINPNTFFYNWLYINALQHHPELADALMEYDAFTDIAFNPEKSLNCQAEAAAIYVSLRKRNLLEEALKSKENFVELVYFAALRKNNTKVHNKSSLIFADEEDSKVKKVVRNNNFMVEKPIVNVVPVSNGSYKSKFSKGSAINHPKFGKGIIVEIEEKKVSATLTIQFSQEKKMLDEQWVLKNCK